MKLQVTYALGCDPSQDAFDRWWAIHNAIDEGNDFASLVALPSFEDAMSKSRQDLVIVVGPEYIVTHSDTDWDGRDL